MILNKGVFIMSSEFKRIMELCDKGKYFEADLELYLIWSQDKISDDEYNTLADIINSHR